MNYREKVRQGYVNIQDNEPKEYEYTYNLLIPVSISIEATSRREADAQLTERVSEYFSETEVKIRKSEIVSVDRYEV